MKQGATGRMPIVSFKQNRITESRARAAGRRTRRAATSDPPAVILGGTLTALSVARSLSDAGVPVHVLDRPDSPARVSRLHKQFVDVGRDDMQARMLEWLHDGPHGAVVLACSDEGLELIARHRADLTGQGYVPMEADDEVLLAMLDKQRTYALAAAHDIGVPRVVALRDATQVRAVSRELSYPCMLKPVHSHLFARRTKSGAKMLTANSAAELERVFERMSAIGVDLLVTEVIAGPDDEYVSYYSYLDEHGEPLIHFTKCKIRQYPPYFGIGTYHATTHDPEVADAGLRFFKAVGLRGLGNAEFKRDGRDGQLKLIECNARFTMANELIRIAGIDLALFSYNRLLGRPTPPVGSYREGARLWDPLKDVRAFIGYRRNGDLSLARWLGSLLYPQHLPVARIDDPLPALFRAWTMARKGARPRPAAPSGSDIAPAFSPMPGPSANSDRQPPEKPAAAAPPTAAAPPAASAPPTAAATAAPPHDRAAPEDSPAKRLRRPGRAPVRSRLSAGLARSRRGAELAARVDLARSAGLRHAWRVLRPRTSPSPPPNGDRHALYERIWREAAAAAGASVEQLAPGLLQLSRGDACTRVCRQAPDVDDPVTLDLSLDKATLHGLIASAGVRMPARLEFPAGRLAPALEFLANAAGPCLVAPATRRSPGLAAVVEWPAELARAHLHAARAADRLLIARWPAGDLYRLLLLDGELIRTLRILPPRLTGDGRSTLHALMLARRESGPPSANGAHGPIAAMNLDIAITLSRARLRLSSVLPLDRTLTLERAMNNHAWAEHVPFEGELAPQLLDEARAAQAAAGLRLAAVDLISAEPASVPPSDGEGAIVDVSGATALCHGCLDAGGASSAAPAIVERLLTRAAGEQPSAEQPSAEQPSAEQASGEQPSGAQSSSAQSSSAQPSSAQPSGEQPPASSPPASSPPASKVQRLPA